MKRRLQPKLTLIGAGPGDPDLITVKGIKALKVANVVLYDALVNTDILKYAPQAIHVFVGKRRGHHRYSQDEINQMIIDSAFNYGNIVRLKGGDPFIFGRGSEEIDYAEKFGLDIEVVPGITSSISVPGNLGVPLTKRGVSESFWVVTGTTSNQKLSKDVYLAAQSTATVVILMGMSKLTQIVTLFKQQNKGGRPVAIIQNGTTINEKFGIGTIDSIVGIVEAKKLASPAIIVIGDVVKESSRLRTIQENFVSLESAQYSNN
ncbi:MAG: uroporphyrinogen-III C-methyltransferase [Crocinitomicaceae bacterium]|nr:uroporphyrinogen-III C-methyltransferase [Crocinitomicaceae bacterium]